LTIRTEPAVREVLARAHIFGWTYLNLVAVDSHRPALQSRMAAGEQALTAGMKHSAGGASDGKKSHVPKGSVVPQLDARRIGGGEEPAIGAEIDILRVLGDILL